VFEDAPVPRAGGLASLKGRAVRRIGVPGSMPWRLALYPPQSGERQAELAVSGPKGSLGKVHLVRQGQPAVLEGSGPGTVEIRHLSGPPVSYRMLRLQPDRGDVTSWGSGVYLFRSLVDAEGRLLERATVANPAAVRLTLVAPSASDRLEIRVPLPGGMRPLSLEPEEAGAPTLPWSSEQGAVVFRPGSLSAGEHAWRIEVETVAAGDYLWPTAQALAPGDVVQGLSGSGRLTINP
jgi:hypothetical protein